jgi:hypothetical protein
VLSVNVPLAGGLKSESCPLRVYVFVDASQAEGVAVTLLIAQRISQSVPAVFPGPSVKDMKPGEFEKFVKRRM